MKLSGKIKTAVGTILAVSAAWQAPEAFPLLKGLIRSAIKYLEKLGVWSPPP